MDVPGPSRHEFAFLSPGGEVAQLPQTEDGADLFGDIPDPLATVRPYMSQLTVHVDASDPATLHLFQTIGLIEELLHGRRQQFGLARNLHLLKRQSNEALFAYARDEVPLPDLRDRLHRNERLAEALIRKREPILEAVDKYLCWSALTDESYRKQRIASFSTRVADIEATQLEREFDRLAERLKADTRQYQRTVFDTLHGIEDSYDRREVLAVADAALDIPALLPAAAEQVTGNSPPTFRVDSLDLQDRFEAAAEILQDSDSAFIRQASETELETHIADQLSREFQVIEENDGIHPDHLTLPLLDMPQERAGTDAGQFSTGSGVAPTELAETLSMAMLRTGVFGGVVHRRDTGQQYDWLVNPTVANEPIEYEHADVSSLPVETYKELWERHFVGTWLLEQLSVAAGASPQRLATEDTEIECPLCALTATQEYCDGARCACAPLVESLSKPEPLYQLPAALNRARDGQ